MGCGMGSDEVGGRPMEGAEACFYGLLRPFVMACGRWVGLMGLMGPMGGCGGGAAAGTPPGCTVGFWELDGHLDGQLDGQLGGQLGGQISCF